MCLEVKPIAAKEKWNKEKKFKLHLAFVLKVIVQKPKHILQDFLKD